MCFTQCVLFSSRMFLRGSMFVLGEESDHLMRTRKTSRCLLYEGSKEVKSIKKKTGKNTYGKKSIHKAVHRMKKK